MNNTDQFKFLFSSIAIQLPVMVVCVFAIAFVVLKWTQAPTASIWALLGFGLTLGLCFVIPIVQTIVQSWLMRSIHIPDRAPILTSLSIFWSLMRALTYALLLVAIFAGRSAPKPQPAPPVH